RQRPGPDGHGTGRHDVQREPVHGLQPGRVAAEPDQPRQPEQRRIGPRDLERAGGPLDGHRPRVQRPAGRAELRARPDGRDRDGALQVSNGDNITAMYFDNNNGLGGSGPVYAYAVVDDSPPVISGTAASNLRFNRADIGWTTDELSDSLVSWGVGTPPGNTTGS